MNMVLIEGQIVNLRAMIRAEFCAESLIVTMHMQDGSQLEFGGFDDEGADVGTPIWNELKRMSRRLNQLPMAMEY